MERKTTKMDNKNYVTDTGQDKNRKDKEKKTYTKENGKERWRWVKIREKVMKQLKG